MKVYIGSYCRWVGPYQISEWLLHYPVKWKWITEDQEHDFGGWLNNHYIGDFCRWIHSFQKRKVEIQIDDHDTWNAFTTISMIVHPLLVKYRDDLHGAGFVDEEDVPEHLRVSAAPELTDVEKNNGHVDDNFHKRWEWVLDEMIFAHAYHANDEAEMMFYDEITNKWDNEAEEKTRERVNNGMRLFAKYYRGLWD